MSAWRRRFAEHSGSRILLLGPAGAGKTTLLRAARRAASPGAPPVVQEDGRPEWSTLGEAVVVDVPGAVTFPPAGVASTGWERLLRQLRRQRQSRPLDAVVLALPAALLFEAGREEERLHLGAAIRERFALLQGVLGFTLPVYVVITKADAIPGFETFAATLTDAQLGNMFGWSSPHGVDEPFSPAWIDEGIDSLHDAVVRARVDRFASSTHLQDRGDLFLFTRTLGQMAAPLRTLLGDVFRPSLYNEAFSCRGFYLCGRAADDASIAFLDDLLAHKVLAERGLARPLQPVTEARRRSVLIAQVTCALLVVGLGLGLYWSYGRLRRAQTEFLALMTRAEEIVVDRRQAVMNGRPLAASYRLHQTRGLLDEQLEAVNSDGFSWVVYRLNPALSGTLTRIFRDIVVEDFRAALEERGRRWLRAAETPAIDPAPSGPNFQDRPRYRSLARFAQAYSPFVDSYRRYEELRRPDGSGTIASLGAISEYLDGTPLRVQALGRPYARALRNANAAPIDCRIFQDPKSGESLVALHAAALLDEFRDWTFDENNPVRSAARDFTEDWELVSTGNGEPQDLESLIASTKAISAAATAWTTLHTTITNQPVALFEQRPFTPRAADPSVCRSLLWPDLGDRLQNVDRVKDSLRDQLVATEVEPFGPLFTDDDAGLALSEPVATLKKDLDTLQVQAFWAPASERFRDETAPRSLPRLATWRAEDLDAAVKTADAFESYRGAAFNTLEYGSRGALLDVVEAEVADVVATRLRRTAVAGSELPPDSAAMLEQLKVTSAVVAKLAPIAPLLSRSQSGGIVLAALDAQATAALGALDREATREYPWVFAWPRRTATLEGLFGRWQTIRGTTAAAEAPKLWEAAADEQRDTVVKFAAAARPFASYLIARRSLSEPALRWGRIGRDVSGYEQKLPDNGLGVLDAFVRKGVPAMLPVNACTAGLTGTARAAGEFFPALRDELVREGERQCRLQIQRDYARVVDVFNRQLKDRFPFVEPVSPSFAERVRAVQSRAEATPDAVKALLDAYRSVDGAAVTRFLESRGTCSGDPALAFLRGVDNAAILLISVADPAMKTPTVVLDVMPEFRLPANPGTGGDQIAEWRLDVGAKSTSEPLAAPVTPLPWSYGDRVSLVVRFARDSPNVPATGAGVPLRSARVEDRIVRFDFTGNWAMFQLLLARTIPSQPNALLLRDVAPNVLALDIPVQPDAAKPPLATPSPASPFEVYMRLGVSPRGKTETLDVGALPTQAPATVACLGT